MTVQRTDVKGDEERSVGVARGKRLTIIGTSMVHATTVTGNAEAPSVFCEDASLRRLAFRGMSVHTGTRWRPESDC